MRRVRDFWQALPQALRPPLLAGTRGVVHLGRCAAQARDLLPSLTSDTRAATLELLRGLAAARWGAAPLHPGLAGELLALHRDAPFLPESVARLAAWVAQQPQQPRDGYTQRLLERRDGPRLLAHLRRRLDERPDDLSALELAVGFGLLEADGEHLRALEPYLAALPDPLAQLLRGRILLGPGGLDNPAAAVIALEAVRTAVPGWLAPAEDLARVRLALGERDAALALYRQLALARPWHVSLLLALHDLALGLDAPAPDALPGPVAVCLYSWNKGADLDATLHALFASELGDARVIILDNGSDDGTPEMLAGWRDRIGERLETLRLPVNIGAPAARNWLLSLPQVRACQFVAFLDDDALVPADWLPRLAVAQRRYPAAGAWGCQIVENRDHARPPHIVQHADMHLTWEEQAHSGPPQWRVLNLHAQSPLAGGFDYLRPCVSVSGCCHVLPTAGLPPDGSFSIRFSPSQYDDLERDLRDGAAGRFVVYQGHLRVRHAKTTGKAGLADARREAMARANRLKLAALHGLEAAATIMAASARLLEMDLLAKLETLGQLFPDDCPPGGGA